MTRTRPSRGGSEHSAGRIRQNSSVLPTGKRADIDAWRDPRRFGRSARRVQKMAAAGKEDGIQLGTFGLGHIGGSAATRGDTLDGNPAGVWREHDDIVRFHDPP
jgi:hypothetical protein